MLLAAGVNAESCGFYWREDGGEVLLWQLARRLLDWRDELMGQ